MAKLRLVKKFNQYQIDYYRDGKRVRRFLGSDKKHAEKELKRVDAIIKVEKLGLPIAQPSQAEVIKPQSNPHTQGPSEKSRIGIFKAIELYLERCEEAVQSGNIRETTCEAKTTLFKVRFTKFLKKKYPGLVYLDQIQKTHIESYRAFRMNSRRRFSPHKKIKPNSFNTDLRDLIAFFNYGIENESLFHIHRNPAAKVAKVQKADKDERPPCLTSGQIKQVLEKCKGDIELRNVIEAFLETGVRYNELRNLRWQDVDLPKGFIAVRSREEFLTKSGKSRTIPLSERMRELLKEIPRRSERLFDLDNIQSIKAKKDSLCNIRKRFDKIKKQLPFLRMGERFHIFRHPTITRWANSGVPLPVVRKWAGHSSVEMTMKYVHPSQEESAQWMKKFSDFTQRRDNRKNDEPPPGPSL